MILVLKKRPLIFLHWYHHFITLLLVWVCLAYKVGPTWAPAGANCFVHIGMYFYYARMARGTEADKKFAARYKQWITRSQIWQFLFDEVVVLAHMKRTYEEDWQCAGGMASVFGVFVLSSFLILFLSFYAASYGRSFGGRLFGGKKPNAKASRSSSGSEAGGSAAPAKSPRAPKAE